MLDRSWNNGPVRPSSQDERPQFGQQSLGIDSSPRAWVLARPVKQAVYHSYSSQNISSHG